MISSTGVTGCTITRLKSCYQMYSPGGSLGIWKSPVWKWFSFFRFSFQANGISRAPSEEMVNSFWIIRKDPQSGSRQSTLALATYLPLGKA